MELPGRGKTTSVYRRLHAAENVVDCFNGLLDGGFTTNLFPTTRCTPWGGQMDAANGKADRIVTDGSGQCR